MSKNEHEAINSTEESLMEQKEGNLQQENKKNIAEIDKLKRMAGNTHKALKESQSKVKV